MPVSIPEDAGPAETFQELLSAPLNHFLLRFSQVQGLLGSSEDGWPC